MQRLSERNRAATRSLTVALVVLGLKFLAFLVTGSVALLSDAAESVVNVAAAIAVLLSVHFAQQPPDYEHPYGHYKAEYFSSAFEGSLILLAAGMILLTGAQRLFDPAPLESLGIGISVALAASLVNGGLYLYIRREGRRLASPALEANARHVLTDIWTSIGVLVGVSLVGLSGFSILDPVLAILVSLNIIREGWGVLTGSLSSLLDVRLPDLEERLIMEALEAHTQVKGFHRLRSRRAGAGRFAEVDIFVEPSMTVLESHDLMVEIEGRVRERLPGLILTVHAEPYVVGVRDRTLSPSDEFRRR